MTAADRRFLSPPATVPAAAWRHPHYFLQQQQCCLQRRQQQKQQQQQQRFFSFLRPHRVRRVLPASLSGISSLSPSGLCCALREAAAKGLASGAFWREADRRLLFLASTLSPAAAAAAVAALATAKHNNEEVLRRLELRAMEIKNVPIKP